MNSPTNNTPPQGYKMTDNTDVQNFEPRPRPQTNRLSFMRWIIAIRVM